MLFEIYDSEFDWGMGVQSWSSCHQGKFIRITAISQRISSIRCSGDVRQLAYSLLVIMYDICDALQHIDKKV